jgi:hypothetical protein
MNIDLKQKDSRAAYFKNFIQENNLREVKNICEPSFIHYNGTSSSRIDYILLDSKWELAGASYELLKDYRNTSTHSALELKVLYAIPPGTTTPPTLSKRINWERGDLDKYRACIKNLLDPKLPCNSTGSAIEHLINSIKLAEELSIPTKSLTKRKAAWNPTTSHSSAIFF